MVDQIVVIGAGIGGLSAAIHLARRGKPVIVLEQSDRVGGKMREHHAAGFRWDTGPSVITMRHVFEELFNSTGRSIQDYLNLMPADPVTRYYYPDGTKLDIRSDLPATLEQIGRIEPRDSNGYLSFLAYAERLHRITGPVFIYDQPPHPGSLLKVSPLDAMRMDGLRTMQQAIHSHVRSPYLEQLLGRFATYVGASPYKAPATLNVIAHMELNLGVWYPQGGIYSIARALKRLADELGVDIQTNCPVEQIELQGGRVRGVRLSRGEFLRAAAVIANGDVTSVYEQLLPPEPQIQRRLNKLQKQELSSSGFIMLLGVKGMHPELVHHNIIFSSDYRREFDQIFRQGVPPDEPSVYITISARSTPSDAPAGCENWFVLVNVPSLNPNFDWQTDGEKYAERVFELLSARGFDMRKRLAYRRAITPYDLEQTSGAWRGALYGSSSNSRWAAFRRPHNRCQEVGGLYFAGGTVHPGGGVPMVMLSGKVAGNLLLADGY